MNIILSRDLGGGWYLHPLPLLMFNMPVSSGGLYMWCYPGFYIWLPSMQMLTRGTPLRSPGSVDGPMKL